MTKERRWFSRIPHAFDVQYRVFGDLTSSWRSVTTLNLSASGVRVRGEDLLESNALLELKLQLPGLREPVIVQGRVIWSSMQASGVSESGVEFKETNPEQQAQIDSLVQFLRKSV